MEERITRFRSIKRECACNERSVEEPVEIGKQERAHPCHQVRSIEKREPFFLFEFERLQSARRVSDRCWNASVAVEDFALANQTHRSMCKRRKVTRRAH